MDKIKRTAVLALSAVLFSFSLSSCGKNTGPEKPDDRTAETTETTQNEETQTTSSSEKITETSAPSTSVIAVTDDKGNTVTASDGSAVTEISVISQPTSKDTVSADASVTSAPAKTSAAETTAAPEQTSQPTVTETSPPETEPEKPSNIPDGVVKFTWLCDGKNNTIYEDGQLAVVTFKIKENAPVGEYAVSLSSVDGSEDGGYASIQGKQCVSEYNGGIVSVGTGSVAPDAQPPEERTYTNLTNACGNPGDTVTMYIDVYNNYYYRMSGFSFKLEFDANVLEIISVTQGSKFDDISKGTFMTTLEKVDIE